MHDFRISLINSVLRKVVKRLRYPLEVMLTCLRWYVVYPPSLRHIEEIMLECGFFVDHAAVYESSSPESKPSTFFARDGWTAPTAKPFKLLISSTALQFDRQTSRPTLYGQTPLLRLSPLLAPVPVFSAEGYLTTKRFEVVRPGKRSIRTRRTLIFAEIGL